MPLNSSALITRRPIDNFVVQYVNDQDKLVAQKLFPLMQVSNRTGSYYVMSRDDQRVNDTTAPSGSEAKAGSFTASLKTFTTKEKAWKGLVLERDARDLDTSVSNLNQLQASYNMNVLLTDLEAAAVTKATTAANYPAANVLTLSGGDTWADAASDPIDDIRAVREAVYGQVGRYPNKMFLPQKGLDYLARHAGVRDYLKYTQPGLPTTQTIASLLDLDEIVVANSTKLTSAEGATDATAAIWGDKAVLAVVDPGNMVKGVTYGKMFLAASLYTKQIDAPLLGRGLGAHWLENGWEYTLEFTTTDASGDALAGGLIDNIF
jgi:hypothetical protein